ncbi:toll/interleukin-1 receptor domain-containing protein [Desulfosarcina cetonica]|uniref:toll/interleukin-1 receptor domain-containing protein n=1 Tax=Desulfosarcina cetonica TaxID=90730 RepID=UPI0006D12740|nr:toll/interleukin-1 receptor domain-containing protein [Desulfosarcina cetonica]
MIYISHANEDSELAIRLYNDLKNEGLFPWIDIEDIFPGENRDGAIRKAIRNSQYFLALISSNSVSHIGYVQKEMKIALDFFKEFSPNSIFIIPVSIDGTRAQDETLESLQYVDLLNYGNGMNRILFFLKGPGRSNNLESLKIDDLNTSTPILQDNSYQSAEPLMPITRPKAKLPKGNWDDIFVGRNLLIEKLMSTRKNAFVFGARRIGKTSLLRNIENNYLKKCLCILRFITGCFNI